jgi:hypothetical protein
MCGPLCRPLRGLTVAARTSQGLRGLALGYALPPTARAQG